MTLWLLGKVIPMQIFFLPEVEHEKKTGQKSYSDAKSILQAFRKDNCSKKSYSYDQSRILVADLS